MGCGSDQGFAEEGAICWNVRDKRTDFGAEQDYHDNINYENFEEWFERLLPNLEPNSVIVMDNASYHSKKVLKIISISFELW